MNKNQIKNNKPTDDFIEKDDLFFKKFFGARKETILRFQNLYQENYFEDQEKERQREEMYSQEFSRLKKYFDIGRGGNVLDIGCGPGGFLSLFGANWKRYGIDISGWARREAEKKGIITDFELKDNFFDLIIFRGTIQHIPDPIYKIGECYYWLKSNGGLVFLITPNTNCLYYKLFNNLPLLSNCRNFFVPSDKILKQILINFGFKIKRIEYPYRNTPYAFPLRDIFYFLLKFLRIRKSIKFSFYKNIMEIYAEKDEK